MATRFVVAGARKDTGVDQELEIEADDAGQAEQIAKIRGLFVSSVRPADVSGPPSPNLDASAAALAFEHRCFTEPESPVISPEPSLASARPDAEIARNRERGALDRKRRFWAILGRGLVVGGGVLILPLLATLDHANNPTNISWLIGWIAFCLVIAGVIARSRSYDEFPVAASNVLTFSQEDFDRQITQIEYGKLPVVQDVDLPIHSGEVCHLMIVATLRTPTKQRVYVGGHSHRLFASVPLSLDGAAFTRGALYVTSDRVVFVAADYSVTENWRLKQFVDASYFPTPGGRSVVMISTTLKRDAGKSFWFEGPQEAQITALLIRKTMECYA